MYDLSCRANGVQDSIYFKWRFLGTSPKRDDIKKIQKYHCIFKWTGLEVPHTIINIS